jgi:predicted Rossmann fold nucleotide-binding protein DprA/Smf involved in DNA uptake
LQLDPALAGISAPLGLDGTPRTAGEIAERLGWTLSQTLAALTELELQGLVRRTAAGRYVAPVPGPR